MEDTNAQEMPMSAEERLAQVEAERKELREKISKDKAERLANAAAKRKDRDEKIESTSKVLVEIQKEIFAYNRSGKVAKSKNDILGTIAKLVEDPNSVEVACEADAETEMESTTETSTGY